ncbi:TPA: hypothetical protein RTG68_001624 [Campylobacter jejuni]|nr:hypothetical protein [Campylobacter jejuni]HDZ5011427.1 hypothetical protein [Campylobacter jejuni]HDZ5014899.1 hypothetical protein [Campylobacter jejuni]HDZ5039460.1 hypothetical protein [Campylobacter jejuni]HDZ5051149.1 hypothetical protein [Campylobacter jejuni]
MTNNQMSMLQKKDNIDEIGKDFLINDYFTQMTIKRNKGTKILGLKHLTNLKYTESQIFEDNVNGAKFKEGIYPVILYFLNKLYENLILTKEDKLFLAKNHRYVRIINENLKGAINIHFYKKNTH